MIGLLQCCAKWALKIILSGLCSRIVSRSLNLLGLYITIETFGKKLGVPLYLMTVNQYHIFTLNHEIHQKRFLIWSFFISRIFWFIQFISIVANSSARLRGTVNNQEYFKSWVLLFLVLFLTDKNVSLSFDLKSFLDTVVSETSAALFGLVWFGRVEPIPD